jgi:YHS domain-containing protein
MLVLAPLSACFGEPKVVLVEQKSHTCMANNQLLEKPQRLVVIEGRKYFGCCEKCNERLEQNSALRIATDPITGKLVDKAEAFIGVNAAGELFYFESKSTLRKFGRS